MTQPPYRRIADEIRARITAGELRPGDPIPSARGITREWGVALATATRVLATLNAEGITRSAPGRGTIVVDPDPSARPAGAGAHAAQTAHAAHAAHAARRNEGDPDLTRERIVAAAIRIADAEGLAQLSMRRIATELGAAPMSLYRHVGGKDELLASMMDQVFGEDFLPDPSAPSAAPARSDLPANGWRAQLELCSRMQWQGFRRHPWLATALSISRPQLIPNAIRHTEWALRALDGLGLTIQEMMLVHTTLVSHMRGLAHNIEAEAQAEQDSGLTSDEWNQTQEQGFRAFADTGEFPLLTRLVNSDMELDLDQLFEFGLGRLLDGLERHLLER